MSRRPLIPHHILQSMLRRKPLDHATERSNNRTDNEAHLKRTLTAADLMLYGVGCSVGAGIYCLVGIGANLAGPAISISFLACGMACMFTSLAYAEFAARFPVTGSAYVYAYCAMGEFWGWLVGWNLTLGYGFTTSVVARSWAEYVHSFFQTLVSMLLQSADTNHTADHGVNYWTKFPVPWIADDYTCSPLSIVIITICTLVLLTGTKESSRFNNFMTVLNIGVLAFVILVGFGSIEADNLVPFAPQGVVGIAQGAGLVFFAFIGFDMVACLSEEVVEPETNMPLGIVGSLVISAFIYVSVSISVIGMSPVDLLGGDTPITNALLANACCSHQQQLLQDAHDMCLNSSCAPVRHYLLSYASRFVSFGAIFGLTSGTFTSLMGQPRIFYGMAQDGLLLPIFGKLDPTTHVPTAGIIITGVVTALLACFVDLEALANMISLGTLMVFTFVDAGVIILRWSPPLQLEDANPAVFVAPAKKSISGPTWLAWVREREVYSNGQKPILCTLLFAGATLLGTIVFTNGWNLGIMWLCVILVLGSTLYLMILPQSPAPETFSCPGVPLVPLIGIACNCFMMGSLPALSWAFTLTWVAIGVAMYFSYGIQHSKLGKGGVLQSSGVVSFSESDPLTEHGETSQKMGYDSTSSTSVNLTI